MADYWAKRIAEEQAKQAAKTQESEKSSNTTNTTISGTTTKAADGTVDWNVENQVAISRLDAATIKAIQTKIGATADGNFGPASKKALQTKVGATADGSIGPKTAQAIQKMLQEENLYAGAIDGKIGYNTLRGLAAWATGQSLESITNTMAETVDWVKENQLAINKNLDKDSIKALQTKLGVTADGDFGPASKKALQKLLGVKEDGIVGPATVKALQEKLKAEGLYTGAVDGLFGKGTGAALAAYAKK